MLSAVCGLTGVFINPLQNKKTQTNKQQTDMKQNKRNQKYKIQT